MPSREGILSFLAGRYPCFKGSFDTFPASYALFQGSYMHIQTNYAAFRDSDDQTLMMVLSITLQAPCRPLSK